MHQAIHFVDRKNTNSIKWDGQTNEFGQEGLQPLWVADMDFQAANCITDALESYVKTGVFGYYKVPDSYYESFQQWEKNYHNFEVEKDWLRFAPGVVPAINWILQTVTAPLDAVLVQTPVYRPFMNAVKTNGRTLITSELINTNGIYTIDFADFESKIVSNDVKAFILCSPHNPVGRVWTRSELETLLCICQKHHVFVISDEIHQDIILGGNEQLPAASLGIHTDSIATLTAATKTFNLAACENSILILPNPEMRRQFDTFTAGIHVTGGNAFGYIAVEAAYQAGRPWLSEVLNIVRENARYVREAFSLHLPKAVISPLEGTYLLWIDLRACFKPEELKEFLQGTCNLAFNYGECFGGPSFTGFIRMNLATSNEMVAAAVQKIIANRK